VQLSQALRISAGDIVAFVGGGGKTTAMFRLAAELAQAGQRVITTTTTRIFAAQIALAPAHIALESASAPTDWTPILAALDQHQHVLITGKVDPESGKAFGVDPRLVSQFARLPGVAAVLNEADGSRMRPFKAPAAHEPVIPAETTLVVPVVGADIFSEPLTDERVHRAERVSELAGAPMGTLLTPALVARVLTHPQGGLKNIPPQACVVSLINKVESQTHFDAAREMAKLLLGNPAIDSVVLGTVKREDAVREVHGRVAAIVLAAGRSTRMGTPKQILPWGDTTLIGEVVRRLEQCALAEMLVVTGAAREAVEASLTNTSARCVFNPDYESSEMARSLQVGLQAMAPNISAVLVVLADQPQMESAVIGAVTQRWRETLAPMVAPAHHGQRGHPMLFDHASWPTLFQLPAHANPREALSAHPIELVNVATDSIFLDLDTPAEYAHAKATRGLV